MRKLNSIFMIWLQLPLCIANAKNSISIHQARGLKKDSCYTQASALTCDRNCTLTLFPKTRKQLTVKVIQTPEKARSALGYFFTTEFRVLNEAGTEVALLSWKPISSKAMRAKQNRAPGLLAGHLCSKQN